MRLLSVVLGSVTFAVPVTASLIDLFGYVAKVEGVSMQPVLNPKGDGRTAVDYVFLNRWAIRTYRFERGEIVSMTLTKVVAQRLQDRFAIPSSYYDRRKLMDYDARSMKIAWKRVRDGPVSNAIFTLRASSPFNPDQKIIKRIVALEGDTVKTLAYKDSEVHVPSGYCWVEGDHHQHSMDSNFFGPVSLGLISAKASHIVWPPARWQRLRVQTRDDHRFSALNSFIDA